MARSEHERAVRDLANQHGWKVSLTKKCHLRLTHEKYHTPIITGGTPSDHRAIKNLRAHLKRAMREVGMESTTAVRAPYRQPTLVETPPEAPAAEAAAEKRKTITRSTAGRITLKLSAVLTQEPLSDPAVYSYASGWSDADVAADVGEGSNADHVRIIRLDLFGKIQSEVRVPKVVVKPLTLAERVTAAESRIEALEALITAS